jgi:hypothetical protein
MESKAGSKFLFYRASSSENRFTLFQTHSSRRGDPDATIATVCCLWIASLAMTVR